MLPDHFSVDFSQEEGIPHLTEHKLIFLIEPSAEFHPGAEGYCSGCSSDNNASYEIPA